MPYVVVPVVKNLTVPWSIVFTSPTRILLTERAGQIRVVKQGVLQDKSLITLPDISSEGEEGLMGMVLSPTYQKDKYIYVCYAYPTAQGNLFDKVVRLIDKGNSAVIDKTILDRIPAATFHAGCRVKFGPDDKLYITTGDATSRALAQDLSSLAGKILRLNAEGTIPSDNPFPNSPVYSYGHRNSQGLDWHPLTGALFASEHGPSIFDGPAGGDEINSIVKGGNYGWPLVSHEKTREGVVSPLLVFTPAIAPSGAAFYRSNKLPQFTNNFFVALLQGEGLLRIQFSDGKEHSIFSYEIMSDINFGRIREVVEGPDGALYFATSNRDGRGTVREEDDKIYKITPVK